MGRGPGIQTWINGHLVADLIVMDTQDSSENPPSAPEDLSNRRIGEFLLLRRLGSGGMADVYLAEQTSLGRNVAIKVLKSDATAAMGGSSVLLKRFEQEARAAGALNHPNLVQIITTGRDGDVSYIVQEYVPGLNLSQWIRKHGTADFATGLGWMQQVASALRAAAEAGIVHRDVKPENIMITRSGIAKVTDFGLAQLTLPASPRMNLTQVGTTLGTPWYMSPEQIQGDKIDYRSDQYSFGITCYQMFAGQPPFPGKNSLTVAVQHLKEDAPPLGELRGDLPKELCDIIHQMISKKPADRFQTPEDLELALQKLSSVPVNARVVGDQGAFGRWLAGFNDLRPAAVATVVLIAVAYASGRQIEQPVRLPILPVAEKVPAESSALRQFALAMLQPDRAAAWEAVIKNYPDTPEADLASLRLGVALMSGAVPDRDRAWEVFTQVRTTGEIAPEKKHLKLLGMIGQAYVLKDRGRSEQWEQLVAEIKDVVEENPEELEYDLDRAPARLRDFFNRILGDEGQSSFLNFGQQGPGIR